MKISEFVEHSLVSSQLKPFQQSALHQNAVQGPGSEFLTFWKIQVSNPLAVSNYFLYVYVLDIEILLYVKRVKISQLAYLLKRLHREHGAVIEVQGL